MQFFGETTSTGLLQTVDAAEALLLPHLGTIMAQQNTNSQDNSTTHFISQLEFSTYLLRMDSKTMSLTGIQRAVLTTMSANAPVSKTSVKTISERSGFGLTSVKEAIKALLKRNILVLVTDSKRNVACSYTFNLQALGYPDNVKLKYSDHIDIKTRIEKQVTARERKNSNIAAALADMGVTKISVGTKSTERDITPPKQREVVTDPKNAKNSDSTTILSELDIPQNSAKLSLPETQIQAENTSSFNGYELNSA